MGTTSSTEAVTILVIYSHVRWEVSHRRRFYAALAKLLSGRVKVLCVDRPLCLVSGLLLKRGQVVRWLKQRGNPVEVDENLFLMTPWLLLHDQLSLGIQPLVSANRVLLRLQIERAIRRVCPQPGPRLSWIAHPLLFDCLHLVNEALSIYECLDEHAAFPGLSEGRKAKLRRYEAKVLGSVDLVFAVSQALVASKSAVNPDAYFMPNAAEVDHFEKALDSSTPVAPEARELKHPVIGFIGGIWGIFHTELLQYIATSRPDWTLLLVGNLSRIGESSFFESFERLTALPNVTWLGWRDYEVLPGYLKPMDVCLLPYVIDEWTVNCHPNKLYQYLAAGKAVVGTDLPEIRPFEGLVRIARSKEQFLALVEEATTDNGPEAISRRRAVAAKNSWDERARLAWSIIERELDSRA